MAEKFPYEDIIELPPHISEKYPQPTLQERAARFAPFAAISGYEEMVLEEARVTEARKEPDENALAMLNEKLNIIRELLPAVPELRITYFEPDQRKTGGAYVTVSGIVKRIEEYEHLVIMTDGRRIPIDEISEIEGRLFDDF